MLDIKILDIIQTITIGVFGLILILFIYFIISKLFVRSKFNQDEFFKWVCEKLLDGNFKESGYIILATVLVYFFGILTGDLTERMSDSNNDTEKSIVLKELNYVSGMLTTSTSRRLSLIDSRDSITTLGSSVFRSLKLMTEANRVENTRYFLEDDGKSLCPDNPQQMAIDYRKSDPAQFDKFIAYAFYAAKNWCYSKEHEPLNELKAIQIRMDLSRSIVLLATIGIQISLGCYLLFLIVNFGSLQTEDQEKKKYYKSVWTTILRSSAVCLIMIVLCNEAFKNCQFSFNRRAFGYYVSHLEKPSKSIEKVTEEKEKYAMLVAIDSILNKSNPQQESESHD